MTPEIGAWYITRFGEDNLALSKIYAEYYFQDLSVNPSVWSVAKVKTYNEAMFWNEFFNFDVEQCTQELFLDFLLAVNKVELGAYEWEFLSRAFNEILVKDLT